MTYLERSDLRKHSSKVIRSWTKNQDAADGRGAYRIPLKTAARIESIVGPDFSEVMQDAGFYRPVKGSHLRNPIQWSTGGRTPHGGEEHIDWLPNQHFWSLLHAVVVHFGADFSA